MFTFGFITPTTAVIVLVIALVVIGPGKLPELGKSLGKGIKEFKSATEEQEKEVEGDTKSIEAKEKVN